MSAQLPSQIFRQIITRETSKTPDILVKAIYNIKYFDAKLQQKADFHLGGRHSQNTKEIRNYSISPNNQESKKPNGYKRYSNQKEFGSKIPVRRFHDEKKRFKLIPVQIDRPNANLVFIPQYIPTATLHETKIPKGSIRMPELKIERMKKRYHNKFNLRKLASFGKTKSIAPQFKLKSHKNVTKKPVSVFVTYIQAKPKSEKIKINNPVFNPTSNKNNEQILQLSRRMYAPVRKRVKKPALGLLRKIVYNVSKQKSIYNTKANDNVVIKPKLKFGKTIPIKPKFTSPKLKRLEKSDTLRVKESLNTYSNKRYKRYLRVNDKLEIKSKKLPKIKFGVVIPEKQKFTSPKLKRLEKSDTLHANESLNAYSNKRNKRYLRADDQLEIKPKKLPKINFGIVVPEKQKFTSLKLNRLKKNYVFLNNVSTNEYFKSEDNRCQRADDTLEIKPKKLRKIVFGTVKKLEKPKLFSPEIKRLKKKFSEQKVLQREPEFKDYFKHDDKLEFKPKKLPKLFVGKIPKVTRNIAIRTFMKNSNDKINLNKTRKDFELNLSKKNRKQTTFKTDNISKVDISSSPRLDEVFCWKPKKKRLPSLLYATPNRKYSTYRKNNVKQKSLKSYNNMLDVKTNCKSLHTLITKCECLFPKPSDLAVRDNKLKIPFEINKVTTSSEKNLHSKNSVIDEPVQSCGMRLLGTFKRHYSTVRNKLVDNELMKYKNPNWSFIDTKMLKSQGDKSHSCQNLSKTSEVNIVRNISHLSARTISPTFISSPFHFLNLNQTRNASDSCGKEPNPCESKPKCTIRKLVEPDPCGPDPCEKICEVKEDPCPKDICKMEKINPCQVEEKNPCMMEKKDPCKMKKKVICPKRKCPPKPKTCKKECLLRRIINFFRARPNCPTPKELKQKRLLDKAKQAAKAAGCELCEPKPKCPKIKKDCRQFSTFGCRNYSYKKKITPKKQNIYSETTAVYVPKSQTKYIGRMYQVKLSKIGVQNKLIRKHLDEEPYTFCQICKVIPETRISHISRVKRLPKYSEKKN